MLSELEFKSDLFDQKQRSYQNSPKEFIKNKKLFKQFNNVEQDHFDMT